MDPANQVDIGDSDSEDIFFGRITKREIKSKLKHFNLCNDELLEPLQKFQDNDFLDDSLIKFYYEDAFPKGSNETYSWMSRYSTSNLTNAEMSEIRDVEDASSTCTGLSQDSLNLSDSVSLTESQLLRKYELSRKLPKSHQDSILSDSVFENNELHQDSLNVDRLSINCKESLSLASDNQSWQELNVHQNTFNINDTKSVPKASLPADSPLKNSNSLSLNYPLKLCDSIASESDNQSWQELNINENASNVNDRKSIPKASLPADSLLKNSNYTSKLIDSSASESDNQSWQELLNVHQNSLNIEDRKSIPIVSLPADSPLNNSKSLSLHYTDNISSNSPESISINSTPQKSNPVSLNSTLESSEYSYSNINDQSGFNGTLEEMEMLLKFGENYMNESKDRSLSTKTESEKENYSPVVRKLSETNDKKSPLANKPQTFIPSVEKNTKSINRQIKTPKIKLTPMNCFKTPSPFPARTITRKSPTYKNIVSPVAMYIKSTPKVPLVQNVVKKTIFSATFKELNSKSDDQENNDVAGKMKPVLPVRCYKPAARNVLLSKENEPAMPASIRKLIKGPLNPEVIKHMGRMHANSAPDDDSTPSMVSSDNDFTLLSSSTFIVPETQGDVSVYVSKNAARSNRLQHT